MIGPVGVAASVVVGLVLVTAGATKIAAGDRWPADAAGLGAPAWAVRFVPMVELVLGSLLVVQVARRPLAVAALVLFGCFTVLIVRILRDGRRPPCACFGAWSARPLDARHVLRNLVLATLAFVAIW